MDAEIFFYRPQLRNKFVKTIIETTTDEAAEEYYRRSRDEAQRLGYSVLEAHHVHNPIVAVSEAVEGAEAARKLAAKFGLRLGEGAGMAWHIIDQRRDGDAVIALLGSDNSPVGCSGSYRVVVAWSPRELARNYYEETATYPLFAWQLDDPTHPLRTTGLD